MNQTTTPVEEVLDLIRVLVFIQILVIFVTAIEALVFGSMSGAIGPAFLTTAAGILTALAYRGIGRRSARWRKWLVRFQIAWIVVGSADLLLALLLAGRGLELVPLITRFVLPWVLIRFLRRSDVAEAFKPHLESSAVTEEPAHVLA